MNDRPHETGSPARTQTPPVVYTQRLNAFSGESTYQLSPHALTWQNGSGQSGEISYQDITRLRSWYHPSRVAENKYHLRIQSRTGTTIEINNLSYISFGKFKENDETYIQFVKALHHALIPFSEKIQFAKGNSHSGYILNALLTFFITTVAILAFWFFINIGIPGIAFIKLAIILFFMPRLFRYIKKNKPQKYTPKNIPDDALPTP